MVRSAPDSSTSPSRERCASKWSRASVSGRPVSSRSSAMTRCGKPAGRVDAGADGGAAQRDLGRAGERRLAAARCRTGPRPRTRRTPGPSVTGVASMRCVRPDFTTVGPLDGLRLERLGQVLERRDQVADDAGGRGHVHRRREHVVRRLRRVDVVVRVHVAARARASPASRAPRWCSCSSWCPSRSGRRRSGSRRRAHRRRRRRRRRRWRPRRPASSTPSSAFARAAAFLMRASASMWLRSRRLPEIGKFSTARWVCAR